jgi:transcriptional regulator CtsR
MGNLADYIEAHIKDLLDATSKNVIELQRRELAEKFECVPSQITYVLSTRFTIDRGYIVESRRGGGGYIRIARVRFGAEEILQLLTRKVVTGLADKELENLLVYLVENNAISPDEALITRAVVEDELQEISPSLRRSFRAKFLRAILIVLLKEYK